MSTHTSRTRPVWITVGITAGLAGLFALAGVVALAVSHSGSNRPLPAFSSLAEHPDNTLHGTVAYYDAAANSVRLVAAAGTPSKTVFVLPSERGVNWAKVGKPAGPQLVWRADGRLEITMFRWSPGEAKNKAPVFERGWQKVVDVRTSRVEDVPLALVPSTPNGTTQPIVNARGDRVSFTADGSNGRVKVTLTTASGSTRTLLAVQGPGEYGYQFGPAFWAPNGQWIAASDDGRILIINPTDPPQTRVLVTGTGGGAGGGSAGPEFAVTAADVLASTK